MKRGEPAPARFIPIAPPHQETGFPARIRGLSQ